MIARAIRCTPRFYIRTRQPGRSSTTSPDPYAEIPNFRPFTNWVFHPMSSLRASGTVDWIRRSDVRRRPRMRATTLTTAPRMITV
jgi:hypothetical protein